MTEPGRRVLRPLVSVMDEASSSRDRPTAEAPMNDNVRIYTPSDPSDGTGLVLESGRDRRQLSLASECSQRTGEVRGLIPARHVSERRFE